MTVESIALEIAELVEKKDKNYNHAFDEACERFGDVYAATKLFEKHKRIQNFMANDIECEEGLDDSLRDLIGYSLLLLRRLNKKTSEMCCEDNE